MKNRRTNEEIANTLTHLVGVIFALATGWLLIAHSINSSWQQLFGMTIFAVAALVVYSGVIIISQQAQIAQLRKESDAINKKITAAKQLNDEYTRLLSSDDEAEYMEKIAIEKLGYAYPNERRFYIVNNSD